MKTVNVVPLIRRRSLFFTTYQSFIGWYAHISRRFDNIVLTFCKGRPMGGVDVVLEY